MDDVLVPDAGACDGGRRGEHRTFVFLAAPPATGKSVLATLLVDRARPPRPRRCRHRGFHYPQATGSARPTSTPSRAACRSQATRVRRTRSTPPHSTAVSSGPGRRRRVARLRPQHARRGAAGPPRHGQPGDRRGQLAAAGRSSVGVARRVTRRSTSSSTRTPHLLRDRLIDRKVRGGATPAQSGRVLRSQRPPQRRARARPHRPQQGRPDAAPATPMDPSSKEETAHEHHTTDRAHPRLPEPQDAHASRRSEDS